MQITKKFQLETLICPSCIMKIEAALNKEKAIQKVKVLFNSRRVKVLYDETEISDDKITEIIEKLGYLVLSVK